MSNHFRILLEVPPMAEDGLGDEVLLNRLSGLYSEAFVAGVAAELEEAKKTDTDEAGDSVNNRVSVIHVRFTYRMHDLSQFMKGLLIGFTRWFNRVHSRKGTLREERFKSVIIRLGTENDRVSVVQLADPDVPEADGISVILKGEGKLVGMSLVF